jgi:hypothetical protein
MDQASESITQMDSVDRPEYLPAPEAESNKPKLRKRFLTVILVFFVVFILLASSLVLFFNKPPTPEMDTLSIYDVAELRGLEVKEDVKFEHISEEDHRESLIESLDYDELAIWEKVFESLFLWDPDDNFTEELVNLYSSEVSGYYSVESKSMFLVDSSDFQASLLMENITLAHEYVHALQDQNFNLSKYMVNTSTDAYNAREAVVEGDAMTLQFEYILSLPEEEFDEFINSFPDGPTESIPYVLEETMKFPYEWGLSFISQIYLEDGWDGVNALYTNPPASTEQIMHPDNYHRKELPIDVSYPAAVPGMDLMIEDTLGEFMVYLMLGNYLDTYTAMDAARGWGGDRYYYYENGKDFLSIFTIEWDSTYNAEKFNSSYNYWATFYPALSVNDNTLKMKHDGTTTTIFHSSDPDLIDMVW